MRFLKGLHQKFYVVTILAHMIQKANASDRIHRYRWPRYVVRAAQFFPLF